MLKLIISALTALLKRTLNIGKKNNYLDSNFSWLKDQIGNEA